MSSKEIIYSKDQIDQIVHELITLSKHCKVFTFNGPLGAGKTTLIRAFLQQMGVAQPVTSPTFTYVNAYENPQGQMFYHFDLYRIQTLDAFIAAGFNEYLYAPNSWALVEWPEVIMPLLTHEVCRCDIEYHDQKRIIKITV